MNSINWDSLVEQVGPRIYRYFQHKGAKELASDLTQDTFIRLIEKRHKFNEDQGPIIAFALGIAHNIWRENNRKNKNHEIYDENIDVASDFDMHLECEKLDQAEKLKLIVARLPKIQQDILYFYFDEEITTREIAEILLIPEGTIKSHLHRAKSLIKAIFEKEHL